MKIKLGIIGEEHAVKIIEEVLLDYRDFDYCVFLDPCEAASTEIIEAHQDKVDVWLVFDQINYRKIVKWGKSQNAVYYIPYRGASFFKVLCELLYKGYRVEELSIDTIPYNDIVRGFKEMHIECKKINYIADNENLELDDYIKEHQRLFALNISKVAVTSSYYVKKSLEKMGIAAFCVLPLRVSIRNILNMILSEVSIKQAVNSQIAVQVFDFDIYGKQYEYCSVDDLYVREITITKKLVEYVKKVQGSLKPTGQGRFFVFTTKGMLSECTDDFKNIPNFKELGALKEDLTACGIGLGNSANEAEFNAVVALRQARECGDGKWFIVFEDKKSRGPLGADSLTEVDFYDESLALISKKTALSIPTLSKIKKIIKDRDNNTLSAQELALSLAILPRSARRILQQLAEGNVAAEIGIAAPGMKGRPKKIFKILI